MTIRRSTDELLSEAHWDGKVPEIVAKLEAQNIRTKRELWTCIGKNFDRGIDELAKAADIDPANLAATLVAIAEKEWEALRLGRPRSMQRLVRHWPESMLILVIVTLAALAIKTPLQPTLVVKRPDGLRPFDVIRQEDVGTELRPRGSSEPGSLDSIVGHYALAAVPAGAAVTPSLVSTFPAGPVERTAVTLETLPTTPPLAPGEIVSIWVTGDTKNGGTPLLIREALVLMLASDATPTRVAWGLKSETLPALQRIRAHARVSVLRSVAAGPPIEDAGIAP